MRITTTYRSVRRPTALALLLALAACGGGGAVLPTEPAGGTGQPPAEDTGGGGTGGDDTGGDTGGGEGGGGGVARPDTVVVLVGESGFSPSSVTVTVGSTVIWRVIDNHHDVTFVDHSPEGGDVPDTEDGESASRTFAAAGTYSYFCDRHDGEESGTVVVVTTGDGGEDPGDPPAGATPIVRTVGDSFSPSSVTIAAGGSVQWQIAGDDHNVTFTGAAPPGGNIPTTGNATVTRTFPTSGRYDYFCTRHSGMSGAVTVQ